MSERLSIDQAAAALGVSRPTIRRRLRNGQLVGSRVPTPQGFVWEVLVDLPTDSPDDSAPGSREPINHGNAVLETELLRLRDEHLADLRRRVEDQAREIAELHRLLAQSQQHLLTAVASGESGDSPATPPTQNGAVPHPEERRRWWQRVGAWLR